MINLTNLTLVLILMGVPLSTCKAGEPKPGDTKPADPKPVAAKPAEPKLLKDMNAAELAKELSNRDPAVAAKALDEVRARFKADPEHAVTELRKSWLLPLQNAEKHDLVAEMALVGILAAPHSTADVEYFQTARVHALLSAGKSDLALAQSKALFNVATLNNSDKALMLLCYCLRANHNGDLKIVRTFIEEQRAGSAESPAAMVNPVTSEMMTAIQPDGSEYQRAIDAAREMDDFSQRGKGNLLLLSGKAKEAKVIFETMLENHKSPNPLTYYESVARAIRAEDGTIGRANAYINSIPEEKLHSKDGSRERF